MADRPNLFDIYDQHPELYAAMIRKLPHNAYLERPAIQSLLPDIAGARVLDAGCGTGNYIPWLLEQGAQEIIGVDISPNMLELARQQIGDKGRVYQHDMRQPLDFLDDESFDLVFSSLVFSYIDNLDALFAEFGRLLRGGGCFLFSTRHPYMDFERHQGRYFETTLVSRIWHVPPGTPIEAESVETQFYKRPLSAITEALAGAGFVIERLIEPTPTADFAAADPEDYEYHLRVPFCVVIRARKA